jgi:hypothetical protein
MLAGDAIEVEGVRLRRCARRACPPIFVIRKRGKYCAPACLQSERKRRYSAMHSGADFRERRRRYCENWLQKNNPGALRHRRSLRTKEK